MDASRKRKMNHGIAMRVDLRRNASAVANVSGTIQRARVSLTVVAICSASLPYFAAAPTTDDVSWIAIADQMPNCVCVRCSACPISGKMNNAIELRMNTVPRETDISSSLAPITGPTAAMALPPQIAVPDEIRCDVVGSI